LQGGEVTPPEVIEAEQAIASIVYDYARAVDTGNLERLREIFRYGAVRVDGVEQEFHGGDAVVEMFRRHTRFYEDGTPSTKHVTTNLLIDVDPSGERATAWSYFTVLQARPQFPLQVVIAGRYLDTFERRNEAWWLVDRFEYCDLVGDLSHHIMDNPLPTG
jgi:hypothetical protein